MYDLTEQATFKYDFKRYMFEKKHIMLLYDALEDYRYVSSRFIADGLQTNDCCIMATDEYSHDQVLKDLRQLGINHEKHLEDGSLILINVQEHYSAGKGFDPEETLTGWQEFTTQSINKGYDNVRAVGEATFAIGGEGLDKKLIYYENIINEKLFPHYPFMSLCVYNKNSYSNDVLKAAIQSHPMMVYGTEVYKHNIYFVPPGIYFGESEDKSEIDRLLTNVKTNNSLVQHIVKHEEKISTIFNNANDAFFIHSPILEECGFIEVNDVACEMLGYSRSELLQMKVTDISANTDKELEIQFEAFANRKQYLFETEVISKQGHFIPVEISSSTFKLDNKTLVFSAARDLSAQKKAEVDYKTAINATDDGIWDYNLHTGEFKYSERWAEMLGYKQREVPAFGCFFDNNIHPADREKFDTAFKDCLSGKEDKYELEIRLKTKDGSYKWIYTRGRIIEWDKSGQAVRILGAHTDITTRVSMEQAMVQTEKMMSIGGLAAGMAHEINNPLAGILGHAQNLKKRLFGTMPANLKCAEECDVSLDKIQNYLTGRDIPKMLQGIQESGNRAAKIVSNMLSFSRKSDKQYGCYNLVDLLDNTLDLASNDYNLEKHYDFRKIKIIRDYETDIPDIYCDGNEIQQVFLNLLKNGAEAMSGKKYANESPQFTCRAKKDSEAVVIEIEDNGPGMDDETRARIFEPFYTTKEVGKGTGLGLSVSYFIITSHHNGIIEVESTPGEWTRFTTRIPLERAVR
ncbi:MEDS domain-containing protein [Desulfovibrio sp. JC010]|uniref:MEDS domain-containing protein n=1 Tax=Desulfovibrio sp. JC010 TaxID=2593641 RepID=UPI0013D46E34|nr:MEDS domain-containing protein [Desulfovibrio sp. JC010]NDV27853.1 PAS domain S-box protein [Desulfovibrio sp. JC010]